MKFQNSQKGVSIYLALMIMIIILAISLGISAIIANQMTMIRGMGDSVIAICAADTGIEEALYDGETPAFHYGPTSVGSASYSVDVVCCVEGNVGCDWSAGECPPGLPQSSDCSALHFCYRSVGTYKGTKRAIEIQY